MAVASCDGATTGRLVEGTAVVDAVQRIHAAESKRPESLTGAGAVALVEEGGKLVRPGASLGCRIEFPAEYTVQSGGRELANHLEPRAPLHADRLDCRIGIVERSIGNHLAADVDAAAGQVDKVLRDVGGAGLLASAWRTSVRSKEARSAADSRDHDSRS